MTDYHVHVGWFSDGYHSPEEIWEAEQKAGITDMFVSSTSTCARLYKQVITELRELKSLGGNHIHPVLWLTPQMFHSNCKWILPFLLHSKIKWEMIKMHWGVHNEWFKNRQIVEKALAVAYKIQVPVLFHSGDKSQCEASVFEKIIAEHQELQFVLAHGRPTNQAIRILSKYQNVVVDTAFMSDENMIEFAKHGFNKSVLFGTDIPINKVFYPKLETSDFILQQKQAYDRIITNNNFEK